MASGIEYRRNAEMCLLLAGSADSPEAKSILMMMAAAWHRLAQEREDTERLIEDIGEAARQG
jgi:hypothetical protein